MRWDNGQFGTYLARNLQKIVLGPVGGANNLGPGGALEAAVPPQGGHQRDMIAGNEEYDDSDQESNYGSR